MEFKKQQNKIQAFLFLGVTVSMNVDSKILQVLNFAKAAGGNTDHGFKSNTL